ncbi:MAG: DUF2202 domain-containing protein [Saprospiraceae bacterium]|nr:DUF2202 domain-containing protein [Saprospiraceae bacterium]
MKKLYPILSVAFLSFIMFSFISCGDDDPIIEEPLVTLTDDEALTLFYLREEEKLARDVYAYLGSLYDHIIFDNIGASEQRHVDFVLEVMDEYDIPDTGSDDAGVYTLPELQDLFNSLTAKGELSLYDALYVGATIEDLDIFDLDAALTETMNEDLINLYEALRCGSSNHIWAFTSQLKMEGDPYTPQFLSQERYDGLLLAGHQSCSGYK